ncbi:uncharacterized protein N0V89_008582 [Didymosphaeria variabile]|uniref:Amidase domain-containing protein n=1 Tax=Didymosphaeria variabile TaxID=1932322 RepID=A0A9W8XG10_9PLEO|nr:uncharacterized protein N0V89_008582 [Didymosphaeria variabile]KAJ4349961.1 hypothetical protein N0V89_008582 [Didymosphaeria variabile]
MPAVGRNYHTIAAEKQRQRQSKVPKEWLLSETYHGITNLMEVPLTCGILSEEERLITSNHDATSLLEKLKSGSWSAEQVTIAFCKRAAIAHQLTNCLTEIFFDEAMKRARGLDRERQADPTKPIRPLHGLPVSLKDSFQVSGYDTSTGLACFVDERAEEDSATAAMLLDLGAVLYCKTNVPQSIMTADSDNNVFGRTLNPRNTALTAGGSTGGEGALIALRGSVLGVVRRGLKKAYDLLQPCSKVELVPLTLPNVQRHYIDLLKYFTLDGAKNYFELFARTGEPEVPSLKAIGLSSMKSTDLLGFFDLNVRRQAAARDYQRLFHSNGIDAILMPPAPHTALPPDQWTSATYTGLWNYLDYPAIVIPVDMVRPSDVADDISNAKYGAEDSRLYRLYTGPKLYKDAPICVQLVGYRYADEALMHTASLVNSIVNGLE